MKRIIKFSKLFVPMVILSAALIAFGVVGLCTKGVNFGVDFQSGLVEQVRIAPQAFALAYDGTQSVNVSVGRSGIDLVVTGAGGENRTYSFPFAEYPQAAAFVAAACEIPGVSLSSPLAAAQGQVATSSLFVDSSIIPRLTLEPYGFHYVSPDMEQVHADEVRDALSEFAEVSVQTAGTPSDRAFQIRLSDDEENGGAELSVALHTVLKRHFGEDNVAVISSDFSAARFSQSLARQAVFLVCGALVLIFLYATFRFRWDFALGAVLAIIHDALIMIAFIVWTQMQFTSTMLAAILTIIGYSINDTVVIFDRMRENMRLHTNMTLTEILDLSQSECLGRTMITTVTTMLAVFALYFFTMGDIKDFALTLIVGLVSGVYSTIYIASAFINFVGKFRKDKGFIKAKEKKSSVASEVGTV